MGKERCRAGGAATSTADVQSLRGASTQAHVGERPQGARQRGEGPAFKHRLLGITSLPGALHLNGFLKTPDPAPGAAFQLW